MPKSKAKTKTVFAKLLVLKRLLLPVIVVCALLLLQVVLAKTLNAFAAMSGPRRFSSFCRFSSLSLSLSSTLSGAYIMNEYNVPWLIQIICIVIFYNLPAQLRAHA